MKLIEWLKKHIEIAIFMGINSLIFLYLIWLIISISLQGGNK